jgi:hypothetical protein
LRATNEVLSSQLIAKLARTTSRKAVPMTELSTITSQPKSTNDITYGYGQSSLGGFLTATNDEGICAVLLGDDRADLLRNLQAAFPDGKLEACDRSGPCNSVADAVAS